MGAASRTPPLGTPTCLTTRGPAPYNPAVLSITKLIALAALLFAVWYGLRWFQRINHLAKSVEQARREAAAPPPPAKTEALAACPVCGTYVAARSPACARPDCPGALRPNA